MMRNIYVEFKYKLSSRKKIVDGQTDRQPDRQMDRVITIRCLLSKQGPNNLCFNSKVFSFTPVTTLHLSEISGSTINY